MLHKLQSLLWPIVIASTIAGLDSCTTQPNVNDTTPPTFEFKVDNLTQNTSNTYIGSNYIHVANGDQLRITACANDDGGLKQFTTSHNSSSQCNGSDATGDSATGPGFVTEQSVDLGLDANGKAPARYCVFLNETLLFNCQPGLTLKDGQWWVDVSATNYANLTGKARFGVTVP